MPRLLSGWSSDVGRHWDARFILGYYAGRCMKCTHEPFKRLIWLDRHLRDKHWQDYVR